MKKKYIYVIAIFLIFNILLFIKPANNIIQQTYLNVKQSLITLQNSIVAPLNNWQEKKELAEENSKLKAQVDELNKEISDFQTKAVVLEQKNEELSKSLEVNEYQENNYLMANVLHKNLGTNLNVLTIDKGTNDKLTDNQIVSYQNKIIGYLTDVQKDQSEVILLNNEDIKFNIPVSIYTEKGKVNAVIQSYNAKNSQLIIEPLTQSENIAKHDKVYTNGYAQSQAENVYVGEINSIKDINSNNKYYTIPLDIDTYDYVEVVL